MNKDYMKKKILRKEATFEDLKFTQHNYYGLGPAFKARMKFKNGYGVSVITGFGSHTTSPKEFEVAIIKGEDICYDSGITEDVIGYCSPESVTEIMKQVQRLKFKAEIIKSYDSATSHNKKYHILKARDGSYYCDCWQWKRKRTCWHLIDFLANHENSMESAIKEVVSIITKT